MNKGDTKLSKREKIEIAGELAADISPTVIAETHGKDVSTIYRLRSKEEVQHMIEEQSQRLLGAVPQAVQNVIELVDDFNKTEERDVFDRKSGKKIGTRIVNKLSPDDRKLAFKANERVLEAPGIFGSQAPSIQIGKIVVNQQTNIISENVLKLLQGTCNALEVEYEEVGE